MGAETVIRKIEEKAMSECEAIRLAADKRCQQIMEKSLADANAKADGIIKTAREKADNALKTVDQQSRLANRLGCLNHKQDLLDNLKADVLKKVLAFDNARKTAVNTRLVCNGSITGEVTVIVPKCDRKLYEDGKLLSDWSKKITELTKIPTSLTLGDEDADILGGMYLQSKLYDIDLSYEARVDELFEENRKSIADRLFAEGGRV